MVNPDYKSQCYVPYNSSSKTQFHEEQDKKIKGNPAFITTFVKKEVEENLREKSLEIPTLQMQKNAISVKLYPSQPIPEQLYADIIKDKLFEDLDRGKAEHM